jgi:sugar (pentulose or hexulose) kinase
MYLGIDLGTSGVIFIANDAFRLNVTPVGRASWGR